MRTNTAISSAAILLALVGGGPSLAQGTFQNLDFEHPVLPLVPSPFGVPIGSAMPGWTGYIGGNQVDRVSYNGLSLGAPLITFLGPGSGEPVIQGRYRVYLQVGFEPPHLPAAIGQTGEIPATALSLRFYSVWGTPAVYFSGQLLPTTVLGAGPNGSELNGADISSFAGQFGELRFEGGGILDNIFFSPQAVPEPGTLALLALGGALLGCLRGRTRP